MATQQPLDQEVHNIWNQNAAFWDEQIGEGNQFQQLLVGPTSELLLDLYPGEQVIEIACGNGIFAKRMAQLGASVTATDFSEKLMENAGFVVNGLEEPAFPASAEGKRWFSWANMKEIPPVLVVKCILHKVQ